MMDPKWPVIAVALISLSLIFNYDLRLGLAASTLLIVVGAIAAWITIRLSPAHGQPRSERAALIGRYAKLSRNREAAQAKDSSAQGRSDPR